jgi:hypothetical protein
MKKNLLVIILFLTILILNSTNLKSNEVFEVMLPTITVTAENKEFKIKQLIDSINTIDIKNLRNIVSNFDTSIIFNYLPVLKSKKLKNYQLKNYIAIIKMKPVWDYLKLKYDIPNFVSISFWIEETGYGKSKLFQNYYNLGGIKSRVEKGSFKAKDDHGDELCFFRTYNLLLKGVDDWAKVLLQNRYMNKITKPDDYKNWIYAYARGGYWSSDRGVYNRIKHIKELNLDKL